LLAFAVIDIDKFQKFFNFISIILARRADKSTMTARKNYGDQERQDLAEYASRTLAASLPDLPGSMGIAQACIYVMKHLARDNRIPCSSTSVLDDRVANGKSELIIGSRDATLKLRNSVKQAL
jgi:hypothetical protein